MRQVSLTILIKTTQTCRVQAILFVQQETRATYKPNCIKSKVHVKCSVIDSLIFVVQEGRILGYEHVQGRS
jgi:hypothetical protein